MPNSLYQTYNQPWMNNLQQYFALRNPYNYLSGIYTDAQTIFDREDSAYQRMVEDMKKAGLNPWTGISSGGLSTSSQSPSLDALNGLISSLSYALDSNALKEKKSYHAWSTAMNVWSTFNQSVNAAANIVNAIKGK